MVNVFQPETKTLVRKLERNLIKLYRYNVSLLFNQSCLNERLPPNHTHTHTYIYIYIYKMNKNEHGVDVPVMLRLWGMRGTSSLPSLSSILKSGYELWMFMLRVTLGEYQLSSVSSAIGHLHEYGKTIQSYQIVPHFR